MSSHLQALHSGESVRAEVDSASLFKLDILANHWDADVIAKDRLESGFLLVTLRKN